MVDLLLQNSGPFLCEGGSFEPTEPPWLRACELLLWLITPSIGWEYSLLPCLSHLTLVDLECKEKHLNL